MTNLTTRHLAAIKPGASRKEYPDGRINGLYFVVQPSDARSWAVRYRFGGKSKKLKIGDFPVIGLAEARELATGALAILARGQDPAAIRKAQRDAENASALAPSHRVADLSEMYLKREVEPNLRSAVETRRMFENRIIPAWGSRSIASIDRSDIVKQIDKIIDDGFPVGANNFFATVRRFFNWAVERGTIEDTPCKGMKPPTKEQSRDRILADHEIGWMWHASLTEGYPFGPLARLLLLTGQRRDEVAGMSWGEIDFDNRLWTIPRDRAKNNREHHVPLCGVVLSEIQALPRIGLTAGFVFTTNGRSHISGYSKAKRRLDMKMLECAQGDPERCDNNSTFPEIPNWRLHDLRRTAASGMARLGVPVHVVEAILNHKSGAVRGVAAVYNRYDYAVEKREALAAWSNFVINKLSLE